MSDKNLVVKPATPVTHNQSSVPFITGPLPPRDSTDPKTGTNVGAGIKSGAPNLHPKSEEETLPVPQTTASSNPLTTTTHPSLSSKPALTSAKSAVSSKYVDMSQLKAELEGVRKMVSEVVTRLLNILERLQNLHAANPATMAKLDRLKAATENLLAAANGVSNELAGIEHEHQTPPSVGAQSGVSAPTQYTFGSSPVTQSGTGKLVQAPTTSALPAKPTDSKVQEKIDEMKQGAYTAFDKLDSLLRKLEEFETVDNALLKPAQDLRPKCSKLLSTTLDLIEEIDQLSANKTKQQIADVEKRLMQLPNDVVRLEKAFAEIERQDNFLDKLKDFTTEITNGKSSSKQANSNSSAEKPVTTPKSTAGSGAPISFGQPVQEGNKDLVESLLASANAQEKKIVANWNLYSGQFLGNEKDVQIQILREEHKKLLDKLQGLLKQLNDTSFVLRKASSAKSTDHPPSDLSLAKANRENILAYQKVLNEITRKVDVFLLKCNKQLGRNTIKEEKA